MPLDENIVILDNIYVIISEWHLKGILSVEGERILSKAINQLQYEMNYVMRNCMKNKV